MKFRRFVCLITVCCLLAGCEKKNNDTQAVSDTSATENIIDTITTTEMVPENTGAAIENTDIPEDAVLKITETTYRDGEVWQTLLKYRNAHDDVVAWGYVNSDGEEELRDHDEYEYNENGKKIYSKSISNSGDYFEVEYLSDNTEKGKGYDENGRLEVETEVINDEYGNPIRSYTIVYDEDGGVILGTIEEKIVYDVDGGVTLGTIVEKFDYDYDENGKILVCRYRSGSDEIISTTTNTYDDNGNILSSEKLYTDGEVYSFYIISHSYEYDDKNNLISEEEIWKGKDDDIVYRTESYEYQYDENGRKIRQDYSNFRVRNADYDDLKDISEYTIYEYTQL
ncbi:MAG: hypothetical protein K2H07_00980 [Lachnospiraceae bacterium]|nr:hypothetical protein [Lachnospiraceae bacterium]